MSTDNTTATDVGGLSYPDEVVTHAHVRLVDLPLGAGRAALITLDNGLDHRKPNTLGPRSLLALDAALDEAYAADGVVAVCLTGKPFIFAAGADLKGVGLVGTQEQARGIAELGHRVQRRLGEGPVPTFGLINGLTLGGGLEVMLHCTYRTVSAAVPAVAFPETFIGLVPGWGGTYLLPRLIGPAGAVQVIIGNALSQNRTLKGPQVAKLGIADVLLDSADFLEQSLRWVAGVVTGAVQVQRPTVDLEDEAAWEAAIAQGRELADEKTRGAAPAPYRALELMSLARTADRDTAFAAEDEALADLIMSEEFRSSNYAFDLVQRRAKRPAGAPDTDLARPVTKVGVVGAGLMASQLATLFVQRLQVPVVLTDLDQERVDRGVAGVRKAIEKQHAKGRISADDVNRLSALVTGTTDRSAFADASLVIEAVFEEMAVKKQVLAEFEEIVSPECLLATNTSSLSITEMAADLRHPERVVGIHFFNPVAVLPLVEVVKAERTDDATLATAFAVGKALKKSCVLVADAPGFVVNRILLKVMGEVTDAADEGTPWDVADAALAPLGLPMSPFVLLQLVGPAVALHVAETLHDAFPDRYNVSPNVTALVEAGKPGIWTWDENGQQVIDPEVQPLLKQGDTPSTSEEVFDRVLVSIAQEARLMLDDGVVTAPQDIDLCMLLGAGWPFHLGGILPYLDRTGVSERVTGKRFLPPGVASLPA